MIIAMPNKTGREWMLYVALLVKFMTIFTLVAKRDVVNIVSHVFSGGITRIGSLDEGVKSDVLVALPERVVFMKE